MFGSGRSLRTRWPSQGRGYARFLAATVELIDAATETVTPFTRLGRIEMRAAILRVLAADRIAHAAFLAPEPSRGRQLEAAVAGLDRARGALADAARYGLGPGSADRPAAAPPGGESTLTCVHCRRGSPPGARGWRAYLLGDDRVATCCPACRPRAFEPRN